MNESQYDNQAIIDYLLGSLPEAEAERFDELSFTDEDFAAALSAAEKDLVDAYIHKELTGERLEKFKSHYLASPLRREKIDFARNFQVYAQQIFAGTKENPASQESKPKRAFGEFLSAINIFKNRNLMQWSFAVLALAFMLAGGWWIINKSLNQPELEIAKQTTPAPINQPPPVEKEISGNSNTERDVAAPENKENQLPETNINQEKTNRQPIAEPTRTPKKETPPVAPPKISIASFILAPPLRGNQVPNFSIPKETSDVAVELQLESADYAAYQVVLVNESGANLWRSGTLKAKNKGDDKVLNVRFPARLLKSQIYSLTVSGIGASGEGEIISNYPFRSVLK